MSESPVVTYTIPASAVQKLIQMKDAFLKQESASGMPFISNGPAGLLNEILNSLDPAVYEYNETAPIQSPNLQFDTYLIEDKCGILVTTMRASSPKDALEKFADSVQSKHTARTMSEVDDIFI
jgi:hypothetical protein